MKSPEELPTPWLEDPNGECPQELLRALREARAEPPPARRLARVALALGLPPDGPDGSGGSGGGAPGSGPGGGGAAPPVPSLPAAASLAAPWVKWAAVVLLAAGPAWYGLRQASDRETAPSSSPPVHEGPAVSTSQVTAPPPAPAAAPVAASTQAAVPGSAAPRIFPPTPTVDAEPTVVRRRRRRPAVRAEAPPAKLTPQAESELDMLERASAQLITQPRAALATAQRARTEYSDGAFAQERDLLTLQALVKLHQNAGAVTAATAFLRDYPASAYDDRVKELRDRALASQGPKR